MIWKIKPSLEVLNQLAPNTMLANLGITFTKVGDQFLIATMPVDERTKQPMGLLHGGASVALAESLGSVAAFLCVEDPSTANVVGVEINANHLKAVKKGMVTGKVTAIRQGKTIQVWNIEITDDAGHLVCTSRLTTMTVPNK